MKRFAVCQTMRAIGHPVPISSAATPQEAYREGQRLQKEKKIGVSIHDKEGSAYLDLEAFAAKHGLR